MARIAGCPRCSCELFVDDGTAANAWAKCPECLAFFQLGDATWRVVPAAQVVREEPVDAGSVDANAVQDVAARQRFTVSSASFPTLEDVASLGGSIAADVEANLAELPTAASMQQCEPTDSSGPVDLPEWATSGAQIYEGKPAALALGRGSDDLPRSSVLREHEPPAIAATLSEAAAIAESAQDSAGRFDQWFRGEAERAGLELAGLPYDASGTPAERAGVEEDASTIDGTADAATIEYPAAVEAEGRVEPDSERQPPVPSPKVRSTWDDSEQMDRLLADVEMTSSDDALEDPIRHDHVAADLRRELGDEPEADDTSEEDPIGAVAPLIFAAGRVPPRRNSALRMVVGTVTSGVVGLALGYYALLWLKGTEGDFLNIAPHLPSAVLPTEAATGATVNADDDKQRAEIQASYTAPVAESDSSVPRDDGLAADEARSTADDAGMLRPFDEPAAQPLADAPRSDGSLLDPPVFTADELAAALQTALQAERNLAAGDLRDSREVQRAKGLSYSLLCDLAQKAAFVERESSSESLRPLVEDAEQLFRRVLSDSHTRNEVAIIVEKWIVSPHRTHGGVFFAGTISQEVERGSVVECRFDLGSSRSLTVLCPQAAALSQHSSRPVAVVGWIVDAPAEKIRGYSGSAPQAVWASRLISLD